jgi:outer membrane protein assembly factor BamB
MRYSRRQALGLAGIAAGCAVGASAGITFGRAERASGHSRVASASSRRGEPLWRRRFSEPAYARLTASGDVVYVSGRDKLDALRARDGSLMWEAPVSQNPPVTHGNLVYTEGFYGGLSALNVTDGALQWGFQDGKSPLATPVFDGPVAYVGVSIPAPLSEHGGIWTLDAQTGTQLWQVPSSIDSLGSPDAPVAAAGGILYTAGLSMMRGLDTRSGTELWRYDTQGDLLITGSLITRSLIPLPRIIGDVVYSHSGSTVFSLSARTGEVLWTSPYPANIFTMEIINGIVYVAGNNGTGEGGYLDSGTVVITALDAANGKKAWTKTGDLLDDVFVIADGISLTCAHPATKISDGIAYSGGADGVTELRATRLSDDRRIWQITGAGMSLTSQPVLARDYACLGFRHESVRVVSMDTGETMWDLPMAVIAGPVVSDSMVFAVGADAAGPGNDVNDVSSKGYVYGIRL